MFTIDRRLYYKECLCGGICVCMMLGALSYYLSDNDNDGMYLGYFGLFMFVIYTLYFLIGLFLPKNNFITLRIDDEGIYLCEKKGKGVFVPWMKIRYVTFIYNDYGSKIAILQHNKTSHYLNLTDYYYVFTPKSAINAARKYADDNSKIKVIKNLHLTFTYETGMWEIEDLIKSPKKIKKSSRGPHT